MHLIGLHGKLHSGKDTTFNLLREEGEKLGLNVKRIAFADYLKVSGAIALGGLGADPTDLSPEGRMNLIDAANHFKESGAIAVWPDDTDEDEPRYISGREFWQVYGTEAHRQAFDAPDFWIDTLLKGAKSFGELQHQYRGVDILVVTDVRFDNEAKALIKLDVSTYDGTRNHQVTIAKVDRGDADEVTHVSEAGISEDLLDLIIDNTGTLDQLRDQVVSLLRYDLGYRGQRARSEL